MRLSSYLFRSFVLLLALLVLLPVALRLPIAGRTPAATPMASSYEPGPLPPAGLAAAASFGSPAAAPAAISPLTNISAIDAGWHSRCAITTSGAALCWGAGIHGQLGNGDIAGALYPEPVTGLESGVVEISAGADFSCARKQQGAGSSSVSCWGANWAGTLGDGVSEASLSPVPVVNLAGDVTSVSAGLSHVCVIVDGMVACWGSNSSGELGIGSASPAVTTPTRLNLTALKVAAGSHHSCALLPSGAVRCWGDGSSGQVGDGANQRRNPAPVDVIGLGGRAVDITAGGAHSCALLDDGRVQCWGANWWGQLGDGTTAPRNTPVYAGISAVAAISAGSSHTCAVTTGGATLCWGDNGSGQLGDGGWSDRPEPVPVAGLEAGVRSVSAGSAHSCAVLDTGTALCWGAGGPLLGVGRDEPDVRTPLIVLQRPVPAALVRSSGE